MREILDLGRVFGYKAFTSTDNRPPTDQRRDPRRKMQSASTTEGRTQTGAKVLALACFAIAAGFLIASLFIPSSARAGKSGHPSAQMSIR